MIVRDAWIGLHSDSSGRKLAWPVVETFKACCVSLHLVLSQVLVVEALEILAQIVARQSVAGARR